MAYVILNCHLDMSGNSIPVAVYGPFEDKEAAEEFNWRENYFPYPESNKILPLYEKEKFS